LLASLGVAREAPPVPICNGRNALRFLLGTGPPRWPRRSHHRGASSILPSKTLTTSPRRSLNPLPQPLLRTLRWTVYCPSCIATCTASTQKLPSFWRECMVLRSSVCPRERSRPRAIMIGGVFSTGSDSYMAHPSLVGQAWGYNKARCWRAEGRRSGRACSASTIECDAGSRGWADRLHWAGREYWGQIGCVVIMSMGALGHWGLVYCV
jgi:hypothetical protein